MSSDWEKDVKRDMDSLFKGYGEKELTIVHNEIRQRVRDIFEKNFVRVHKHCDRCNWSSARLTDRCTNCGGQLREFEVTTDGDRRFKTPDFAK